MLTIYIILFLSYLICDSVYRMAKSMLYAGKIRGLLERVSTKEQLLRTGEKDILNMLALMFRKMGYKVEKTDLCGECLNGLILNDVIFVELWKNAPGHLIEIETAIKLAYCMRRASVYRGMLVTLGDFKRNTRLFCHKYVIQCVNGDQLVEMLREVQAPTLPLKINQPG